MPNQTNYQIIINALADMRNDLYQIALMRRRNADCRLLRALLDAHVAVGDIYDSLLYA
jgi:hypothetical protein